MNDRDLDQLVASTSPVNEYTLAGLALDGPEADLLEAIMSLPRSPELSPPKAPLPRPKPTWRRRFLAPVATGLAIAVGVVGFQQVGRDGEGTAWAAPLLAVAEAAPRLLVDEAGWSVIRADEFAAAAGELDVAKGSQQLSLSWEPAARHEAKLAGRARESDYRETLAVTGRSAQLFRYTGTSDYTTQWIMGDHSVQARGVFADLAAYRDVLAAIRQVDVDTWLNAMPASVIKPDGRATVVDQMLADIPVPAGFDRGPLTTSAQLKDRYQLGAAVAGSVACAWIGTWVAANDAGDTAAATQAVNAMASSHRWAILLEMQDQGAYSDALWELADAMATDAPVSGGKPVTIRESYARALGCTNR